MTLTAMPKYEAYRDSKIEWIGDIPKEWELTKLGACLTPVSIKNRPDLPLLSITRELGVIERDIEDQDSNHNFIPDDLSGYKVIESGQFGMNKMKAWQGSYGVSKYTGIVSPAYYVFKFEKDIDPDFFHWAIRSHLYISFFASASDGVRIGQWDLSKDRMKEIPFVYPPKSTQTAIANFLDTKTAQIDEAIAIKEQQIALLNERKQILIQQAVTQGLDPTVPMKDSGVEWIGKIPEHWTTLANKNIFKVRKELVGSRSNEYTLLSLTLRGVIKRNMENPEGKFPSEFNTYQKVREGDFVFCLFDVEETPRTVGLSSYNGMITGAYTVFETTRKINKMFLYYFYLFLDQNKRLKPLYKGLRNTVPKDSFMAFKTLIPPLDEQDLIVDILTKRLDEINKMELIIKAQFEKLKEYKTTLINSAVTGKIKVV